MTNFERDRDAPDLVERVLELEGTDERRVLLRFVGERGEVESELDRVQLVRRARALAGHLETVSGLRPGERAVLVYLPSIDFVVALLGCLFAGVVPVPVYPPSPVNLRKDLAGFGRIVRDCGATLVLSHRPYTRAKRLLGLRQLLKADRIRWPRGARWLDTDRDDVVTHAAASPRTPNPDAVALLQYTSGSTSEPKGVMISHRNIAHQLAFNRRAIGLGPETRAVMWVPQYHDFGLISGILNALMGHGELTMLSPLTFVKRPSSWPETMSRYRTTHTAAPNFGYELAVQRTTAAQRASWDLSSLEIAMSAAEPVRPDTVARFVDAFAASGFRAEAFCPSYGLAEHTVGITTNGRGVLHVNRERFESEGRAAVVPAPGANESASGTIALSACGRAGENIDLRIVDPETGVPRADGEVGEIWADSESKALGYWGLPELSRETFAARLATDAPSGRKGTYLRTGDLGFLHEGQLYVSGRLKDLIILAGRNLYPQDIELTAQSADTRLRPGCVVAFSIAADETEGVVVVAELRGRRAAEPSATADAVRRAVAREHGVVCREVVLITARTIPKTTSGKVQRRRTRQAWLDGTLEIVHRSAAPRTTAPAPAATTPTASSAPNASTDAPVAAADPVAIPASAESESASSPPPVPVSPDPRVDDLDGALVALIADELGLPVERLDRRAPLASQGMSSLQAVKIAAALGERVGRDVPVAMLFDHPGVETLLRALRTDAPATDRSAPSPAARPAPVADARTRAVMPVAVIGIGCRFPGGITDPASFWRLLETGVDAVEEIPPERWDIDAYFDPAPGKRGKMNTRWGGILPDVDRFDPRFFGIKRSEAGSIDPQQRLLLECSWEAIEHAGILPADLEGSPTGVYMGLCGNDYQLMATVDAEALSAYAMIGSLHSTSVGRVSYALGLEGPNVPIDTACSSSLVAVHLACQAMRGGDCTMALAGGVNLTLIPEATVHFSRMRAMSPDGRCKTFSAAANGYVRSEGCGVLLLKPLEQATRDGDRVLAVIRGSAVNQDGRSNGLTAPRGVAQRRVVERALEAAALAPSDIDYVECHGTGTPLGDPVEVRALADVQRAGGERRTPLLVGSIKSNIGHTEAAAGVAGLIKAVLCLGQGTVPSSLHARPLNPDIPWDELSIAVADRATPWPSTAAPRRAGVSAFGFSGTNAHVIVEQAPADPHRPSDEPAPGAAELFLVSAHTPAALERTRRNLAARLEAESLDPAALAHTLAVRRTHHRYRHAVVARDTRELAAALGASAPERRPAPDTASDAPRLAMLFSGQGAQRAGMGRELAARWPRFRETLERIEAQLPLPRPLRELMFDDDPRLHETRVTQPALFAFETALFALWESWGVSPELLIGHSVGEYAAAHAAGVFDLPDACRLVAARGRLMQEMTPAGRVVAIAATEAEVARATRAHAARASVALVNAPEAVVVSGDTEAVDAIAAAFVERGTRVTPLAVSHAVHSPLMEPMLDAFRDVAESVRYRAPSRPLLSGLSGTFAAAGDVDTADYWVRHVRETVRFGDAVGAAQAHGITTWLELGPSAPLLPMVAQTLGAGGRAEAGATLIASAVPGRTEDDALLEALGHWWWAGGAIDRRRVFERDYPPVTLPTYAFERESHWLPGAGPGRSERLARTAASTRHSGDGKTTSAPATRHPPTDSREDETGGTASLVERLTDTLAPWWRSSIPAPMSTPLEALGLTSLDRMEFWSALTARFPSLERAGLDHASLGTLEELLGVLERLEADAGAPHSPATPPANDARTERIRIDTADPVFFDHAYDHLPGVLVLDALCRSVPSDASTPDAETVRRGWPIVSLSLEFERWLDVAGHVELRLDEATSSADDRHRCTGAIGQRRDGRWQRCARFSLTRGAPGTWRPDVRSRDAEAEDGASRTTLADPAARGSRAAADARGAAPALPPLSLEAAHKTRDDNVLVSAVSRHGPAWRCRPRHVEGHVLMHAREHYSPTHLAEMARQLVTGVAHALAPERMAARRFVLLALRLELPQPIPHAADLALELEMPPLDLDARASAADAVVTLRVDGRPRGQLLLSGQSVDEADYATLRGPEVHAVD